MYRSLFGVICFVWTALAQETKYCPPDQSGLCYGVNVPAATVQSGAGDIFFQISAPSTLQWAALGQGSSMSGSNIFVIYADDSGSNVTISPRAGTGHSQPSFDSTAKVTLLSGSGISNGLMVANVKCSSCQKWGSGTLDPKSTSSNWIWAVKEGSPLHSSDPNAKIDQHDDFGQMTFDLTKAAGGSSLNPFGSASTAPSPNSPSNHPSTSPPSNSQAYHSPSESTSTSANSSSDSSPLSTTSYGSSSGDEESGDTPEMSTLAHGLVMSLVIVVIFPAAALTMRVFHSPRIIWVHVSLQLLGLLLLLIGFGLGVKVAKANEEAFNNAHTIFGTLIVSLFLLQPFIGLLQHAHYRKTGRRSAWGTTHIWYGRALIILGVINGGLGLQLSANTVQGVVAYCMITGVVFFVYLSALLSAYYQARSAKERERRSFKSSMVGVGPGPLW